MMKSNWLRSIIALGVCGLPGAGWGYEASVKVDVEKRLGMIDPAIYGQYLEHVQEQDECIYPSIWDNTSARSDAMGLRKDVIEAAKEMKVPIVRWPGGCFADVYHWENGIGPREKRPVLENKHWKGMESHQFGTDEFLTWSEKVGNAAYVNVNLGSGTLEEALRWLEYANGDSGTEQGKRRAANGREMPYNVPFWGIGNETWAPWETGQMDAPTYAKTLAVWAAAMKKQDPSIKLLAVGSNAGSDPVWDKEVLSKAGHLIDYLTLHVYGSSVLGSSSNYEKVVFAPDVMDFRIKRMLKTIDEAKAESGFTNEVKISIDEWNIRRFEGKGSFEETLKRKAPRDVTDTLFVGGFLNAMIRNSPRVGMANYVFLVNGHAPLLVNESGVVKTPLFHLFKEYAEAMKGSALEVEVAGPVVKPKALLLGGHAPGKLPKGYELKDLPYLDAASAIREDGSIVISLINRHETDSAEVKLDLPAAYRVMKAWTLGDDDKHAANDFANPDRVMPVVENVTKEVKTWSCEAGRVVLLTCEKN